MFSAPCEFDRQDEGHTAYDPIAWKVITTYYPVIGYYPYKKYNGVTVFTGPLAGTQNNNELYVKKHFATSHDWRLLHKIKDKKNWQR